MDDDDINFILAAYNRQDQLVNLIKPIELEGHLSDFHPTKKLIISPARDENRKSFNKKQNCLSTTVSCTSTGCNGNISEKMHSILKVPICNSCSDNIQKSLKTTKRKHDSIYHKSDIYCLWCGIEYRKELRSCNKCTRGFCERCLAHNFNRRQEASITKNKMWTCFVCEETPDYKSLVDKYSNAALLPGYKLYQIINTVSPIKTFEQYKMISLDDVTLTKRERVFASLFIGDIFADHLKIVSNYLTARDYMGVMFSVSRSTRKLLKKKVCLIPGFLDFVKLYEHQIESLNALNQIENSTSDGGNHRGGIFADEPGLGKTATILALICSSAGTLPYHPKPKWDNNKIEELWHQFDIQRRLDNIRQILNNIITYSRKLHIYDNDEIYSEFIRPENLTNIVNDTLRSIRIKISNDLLDKIVIYDNEKSDLLEILQKGINDIRLELSDIKCRLSTSITLDPSDKFLRTSAGTLIVVPHSMLEHWYEQINKFINLQYISSSRTYDKRGIVYIIGLGDIVDLVPPLSKYEIKNRTTHDLFHLSTYLIVITTFERCSREYKICDQSVVSGTPISLTIRWLRLIIDEGHELLKSNRTLSLSPNFEDNLKRNLSSLSTNGVKPSNNTNSNASINNKISDISKDLISYSSDNLQLFLSQIVAERRWVMTGTPISSKSEAVFDELFKLLSFCKYKESKQDWEKKFKKPCLNLSDSIAWKRMEDLIKNTFVRHKKTCLTLYDPIIQTEYIKEQFDPQDEVSTAEHRAKADYISKTMEVAKSVFSKSVEKNKRKPKFIVFSQNDDTLQNVGIYQSAELSRFRNSKTKFKRCPLCGFKCNDFFCNNRLYAIKYLDLPDHPQDQILLPPPSPSGHCVDGTGGHYTGICLCSPEGCKTLLKSCFSNPFYKDDDNLNEIFNAAIVSSEHIKEYVIGEEFSIGQVLSIKRLAPTNCSIKPQILWQNGILGGEAELLKFKLCGGAMKWRSWFPGNILQNVTSTVEDEDASVLLLNSVGSTGLDLSFVTHIFLLEPIDNTSLMNQIISRANRMGATGPVLVTFIKIIKKDVQSSKT